MEYNLAKGVLYRFLRGAVSGAVATMVTVQVLSGNSWGDIIAWLNTLAIGGVIGFITGGLLAVDKYLRETTNLPL